MISGKSRSQGRELGKSGAPQGTEKIRDCVMNVSVSVSM